MEGASAPVETPASRGSAWATEFKTFLLRGKRRRSRGRNRHRRRFRRARDGDGRRPDHAGDRRHFRETRLLGLKFVINKSTFLYGDFINKTLAFATIAAAVFFFVV